MSVRTIAEIGIGLLFAVGAVFNAVYTLRHGDEFYGSFGTGAWFPPARLLVNRVVMPNARLFTVILIVFQVAVVIVILSRGSLVTAGLVAGAIFAVLAALASSPGGTVGNLALAAILITLAASR